MRLKKNKLLKTTR